MSEVIYAGTTVTIYIDLRDSETDTPIIDPAEIEITVTHPDGAISTYLYSRGDVVAATEAGRYRMKVTPSVAGVVRAVAVATSAAGDSVVTVVYFVAREV